MCTRQLVRIPRNAAIAASIWVGLAALSLHGGAVGADAPPTGRVLELFTSHGCSSCPPAERLLGELIEEDPSLVALEFHVDYWNSLVHGVSGNFVDPFSDVDWSLRQRSYDGRELTGRQGVYTPQAILDGQYVAVGSDAARITGALDAEPPASPDIQFGRDGDDILVAVAGVTWGERERRTFGHLPAPVPDTGEIALVRFLYEATTAITGGENKGLEQVNHRIVTSVEALGRVGADGSLRARVAAPTTAGEGCAVIVRHGDDVALLSGRLCPDSV